MIVHRAWWVDERAPGIAKWNEIPTDCVAAIIIITTAVSISHSSYIYILTE